jgi:NAD(P)-dependent dehydrogenase (short-subunit alcohol dehydrogenase family)
MTPNNAFTPFSVRGSVALISGANRGLGRIFAQGLIARVYGGARNLDAVKDPGRLFAGRPRGTARSGRRGREPSGFHPAYEGGERGAAGGGRPGRPGAVPQRDAVLAGRGDLDAVVAAA